MSITHKTLALKYWWASALSEVLTFPFDLYVYATLNEVSHPQLTEEVEVILIEVTPWQTAWGTRNIGSAAQIPRRHVKEN